MDANFSLILKKKREEQLEASRQKMYDSTISNCDSLVQVSHVEKKSDSMSQLPDRTNMAVDLENSMMFCKGNKSWGNLSDAEDSFLALERQCNMEDKHERLMNANDTLLFDIEPPAEMWNQTINQSMAIGNFNEDEISHKIFDNKTKSPGNYFNYKRPSIIMEESSLESSSICANLSLTPTKSSLNETGSTIENVKDKSESTIVSIKDKSESTIENVNDKSESTIETIKDDTESAIDPVQDKAESTIKSIKDKSESTFESIREKTESTIENVKDQTESTIESIRDENECSAKTVKELSKNSCDISKESDISGKEYKLSLFSHRNPTKEKRQRRGTFAFKRANYTFFPDENMAPINETSSSFVENEINETPPNKLIDVETPVKNIQTPQNKLIDVQTPPNNVSIDDDADKFNNTLERVEYFLEKGKQLLEETPVAHRKSHHTSLLETPLFSCKRKRLISEMASEMLPLPKRGPLIDFSTPEVTNQSRFSKFNKK